MGSPKARCNSFQVDTDRCLVAVIAIPFSVVVSQHAPCKRGSRRLANRAWRGVRGRGHNRSADSDRHDRGRWQLYFEPRRRATRAIEGSRGNGFRGVEGVVRLQRVTVQYASL